MENVIEDFDSFIDFEIEERLLDELDELNIKKKEILYNRDDKEREIKKLHELIEKEIFPKEYEECRKY